MSFRVAHFLCLFLVSSTSLACFIHHQNFSRVPPLTILLAFFLILNTLICIWEISLGININLIRKDYENLRTKYKNKNDAVIALMMEPLSLSKVLSLKFWSKIWSTYSLYDPSYSNIESFGFYIDVGNGWTTIIPSLLYLVCMISKNPLIDARLMGIIGILKFYQEFYGTVLYFLSYILNKRYQGVSLMTVLLFVGLSNGLWFFIPMAGMYTSYEMINTGSYAIFH